MKKTIIPLIFIFTLSLSIFLSYKIGYNNGRKSSDAADSNIYGTTFYAEIEEINESKLILVEGLDVNDINFRSKFTFIVDEDTILEWRYTKIDFSDLKVGHRIAVTFTGAIQEKYPAHITRVDKIVLLDDEV